MSLEYRPEMICLICGSGTFYPHDRSEDPTYEEEIECRNCRLYHYNFIYSYREERIGLVIKERIGLVIKEWDYTLSVGNHNSKGLIEEAKIIYSSTVAMGMVKCILGKVSWLEDTTALLVFADWCLENNLALHDTTLQEYASRDHKVQ